LPAKIYRYFVRQYLFAEKKKKKKKDKNKKKKPNKETK